MRRFRREYARLMEEMTEPGKKDETEDALMSFVVTAMKLLMPACRCGWNLELKLELLQKLY